MSDCSNQSGYDAIMLHIDFVGEEQPWTYPLALNGRVIERVTIGGVLYERVRECEFKWTGRYCPPGCMVPQDMVQTCSACGGLGNDPSRPFHPDDPNEPIQFTNLPSYIRYCPLCGARVREGE